MSDSSQGPGWWVASDGKWYPPETHPDYSPPPARPEPTPLPAGPEPTPLPGDGSPTSQQPPTPVGSLDPAPEAGPHALTQDSSRGRRFPLWLVIVALLVGVGIGAGAESTTKKTVTASVASATTSTAEVETTSSIETTTSTVATTTSTVATTTTAPKQDLQIEAGMSTGVDSIGTRYTIAGAVVTNPNLSLAAYGVSVQFNLVDGAGAVTDTETTKVDYIPAGGKALVAPLQIGFDAPSAPSRVDVTAIVDNFSTDTGYHADFSINKGITLTVVSATIARDQYFSSVKGQVKNPSTMVIDHATVTCILRAGGKLVGGDETGIFDPIAPGATIAFEVSISQLPPGADSTECQIFG